MDQPLDAGGAGGLGDRPGARDMDGLVALAAALEGMPAALITAWLPAMAMATDCGMPEVGAHQR